MTEKLQLSADSVLVKLYGGVSGVTRRAEDKGTTTDGRAVETKNLITTRQADAVEAEKARKLLSKLRTIVDSHTTTVLNLSIAQASDLPKLREEIAATQVQIDAHNKSAKYHFIDRSLIMAPIALQADPAALTEVCRQISDELKTARAFFDPVAANQAAMDLDTWRTPVTNWIKRTRGLGSLFPTITGQCIAEAIESVKTLRESVIDSCKAFSKAGHTDESALKNALQAVVSVPGALGLLDNAIGLTVITDSDAKAASDALRSEGGSVEVSGEAVH